MNIKDQTNYVLTHPAWKTAMNDEQAMFMLLYDIQLHCIDTQIKNSAKEFGICKRMNASDIKENLLSMRQPENLNLFLPIPKPCVVVSMVKRKAAKYFNPLQLSLFPDWPLRVDSRLQG